MDQISFYPRTFLCRDLNTHSRISDNNDDHYNDHDRDDDDDDDVAEADNNDLDVYVFGHQHHNENKKNLIASHTDACI